MEPKKQASKQERKNELNARNGFPYVTLDEGNRTKQQDQSY